MLWLAYPVVHFQISTENVGPLHKHTNRDMFFICW